MPSDLFDQGLDFVRVLNIAQVNWLIVSFKEAKVLADFGKKFLLGLVIAACVVGAHAAVVYSVVG